MLVAVGLVGKGCGKLAAAGFAAEAAPAAAGVALYINRSSNSVNSSGLCEGGAGRRPAQARTLASASLTAMRAS